MVHRTDRFSLFDRGVSPVVGVILMVAITVILAAVLGQYVLDLASILQQPPQAGVTINEEYDEFSGNYNVSVLVTSMPNADKITVQCSTCGGSFTPKTMDEVGDAATVTGLQEGDQIVIIAQLGGTDNRQVIRTHTVGGG